MAGSAPFFVTSATLTTPAADAKDSKKRKEGASECRLLRSSLEDLVVSKREQSVALSVRVLLDETVHDKRLVANRVRV